MRLLGERSWLGAGRPEPSHQFGVCLSGGTKKLLPSEAVSLSYIPRPELSCRSGTAFILSLCRKPSLSLMSSQNLLIGEGLESPRKAEGGWQTAF